MKSVPSRFKKNETVLRYQEVHKQLKDQYSRTRQMMEQAMEDRTVFEAWELLELQSNPVAGPIVTPLVLLRADQADREPGLSGEQQEAALGLLTREGLVDWTGTITPVQEDTGFLIAHPWDLYVKGCWHQYQRLLFEKQIRQPFKQVFRVCEAGGGTGKDRISHVCGKSDPAEENGGDPADQTLGGRL